MLKQDLLFFFHLLGFLFNLEEGCLLIRPNDDNDLFIFLPLNIYRKIPVGFCIAKQLCKLGESGSFG